MIRGFRRSLQVVALAGTILVGIVAVALIVSQTPWFRDWLRRYVVRESKQYLNGELSIGRIGGNLLFGVDVSDVAVDVSGERVVAVKNVELDYNIFDFISKGIVLDEIKVSSPVLHIERDGDGWNLGRLVKVQAKEKDREGPGTAISLARIEIADASVSIDDRLGADGYRLPERLDDLDIRAGYEYAPVRYSLDIDHISFRAASPQLHLTELTGKIAVREDNLYVENVSVRTAESSLTIDGVVEQYLKTPIVKVTTTGRASLPELAKVLPAAAGYSLHPSFSVRAAGPSDKLALTLDVKSEAGHVRGDVTADVHAPDLAVRGGVHLERLNLAPLLKDPAQTTDLTGRAELDLRMASAPESRSALSRVSGTYKFEGPRVLAAGYTATAVRASGALSDGRISIDGRASAYGATATAKGFIAPAVEGSPLRFDLRGSAKAVDLRKLPARVGAPQLATALTVSDYRIAGEGQAIEGTARLDESTVEGTTVAQETTVEFRLAPEGISYAARGHVADLNLQRVGRALNVAALDKPSYESRLNGDFDVKGSVPRTPRNTSPDDRLRGMTVDASGTLRGSTILKGSLPRLGFDAHLKDGSLRVHADGGFEGFDPAALSGRKELQGNVSGTLNASATIADVAAPITPKAIVGEGTVNIQQSAIGSLKIDAASLEGKYASQIGDVTTLQVTGPDLKVDASGRVALDRTTASNLKYRVELPNLTEVAKLAGQSGVSGSAVLEGTLTGNASALQTTGTVEGNNVAYNDNKALDLNTRYTITIPELTVKDAKVEATSSASFVAAGGLQISALTATTTYEKQRIEFKTNVKEKTRELDAAGSVVLHPDHQEIHLPELAIRTQGVEWRTVSGSEAAIQYGASQIVVENVKLASGAQTLDVSGVLPVKGAGVEGKSQIKARARNVDLHQLETLLLQDRGLNGTLDADATISGTTEAPAVDGRVEVRNGGFKTYKYESLVANVDYGATRVDIDAKLQQSPTEFVTAKGTMPTSLFQPSTKAGHVGETVGDTIDLQIKSTPLNLAVVQGFTDQVTNVTGSFEVDIRVTGSGHDPHLEGFVDVKNGAFGVPVGGVSYRGLDTRIELEPDRVRLQKFTLLDEHNEALHVSGELAVHERQIGGVNVNIDSDNFEVIDNELGDVGVDSKLQVTGELRKPRVVGEVRLEAARVEVDRVLESFYDPYAVEALPDVVSAEQTIEGSSSAEDAAREALQRAGVSAAPPAAEAAAPEAPAASSGAFAPVSLDVRLVIPDNLVLRGRKLRPGGPNGAAVGDMNITVGGDLRVRKDVDGPVFLLGNVETIRGTYDFQGRRFDLVRGGTLRFQGESELNPVIDVSATRLIPNSGVTATVHVKGTAKNPHLELTSTPPLEESDILALIIFNRPVNELGTGERASLATTAGGIATGFIAAPLGESIGRALDLDLFEITTTNDEGELGAGLTVGQQIGDRAFLKLRQQFGDRSVTEFLLDYQIERFLRLQLSGAPETTGSANRIGERRIEKAGVDMFFFFSY
jgi:autotransporter translocation and assembly factor TamB